MNTFLLNHLYHESERLSVAEQIKLTRMLLDRIREASTPTTLQTGIARLRDLVRPVNLPAEAETEEQ
jgi:hypothetical protein